MVFDSRGEEEGIKDTTKNSVVLMGNNNHIVPVMAHERFEFKEN